MKNIYTLLFVLFSTQVLAQSVYVPDDNFEQALIDLGFDDFLDDFVTVESVDTITFLILDHREISSLEGIAAFTNLVTFGCAFNNLTTLDLSSNIQLKVLDCGDNVLTDLNLSENIYLEKLFCDRNTLTSLNLSNNPNLNKLACSSNLLTTLDLSANPLLYYVDLPNNSVTNLDLSSLPLLKHLNCNSNGIETIDLSDNIHLEWLECMNNELLELNVTNCPDLDFFNCGYNPFTELDLTNNNALVMFFCNYTQVVSLNLDENVNLQRVHMRDGQLEHLSIKNGNNTDIMYAYDFDLTNNPRLGCVAVDDTAYSETFWTMVDDGLIYSENCGFSDVDKRVVAEINIFPNPTSDVLNIAVNSASFECKIYSVSGELVLSYQLLEGVNELDIRALNKGLYHIQITKNGVSYNEHLIVQ